MKFRELQPWIQRRYINENIKEYFKYVRVENEEYRAAEKNAKDFLTYRGLKLPEHEINSELEIKLLDDRISDNLKETLQKILKTKTDENVKRIIGEAISSIQWLESFVEKEHYNPCIYHYNRYGIRFKGLESLWFDAEVVSELQKRKEAIIEYVADVDEKRCVQEQFITLLFDESADTKKLKDIWLEIEEFHIRKINKAAIYVDVILTVAYDIIANGIVCCDFYGTVIKILKEDEKTEYEQKGIIVKKIKTA